MSSRRSLFQLFREARKAGLSRDKATTQAIERKFLKKQKNRVEDLTRKKEAA